MDRIESRNMVSLTTVLLVACCAQVLSVTPDQIKKTLQTIADEKSKKYNCSISLGFKNADMEVAAAAGIADFSTQRHITVDDAFAWGSGTKPLTGASILKLISEGHFTLATPIHELLDPILLKLSKENPKQKFKSMVSHSLEIDTKYSVHTSPPFRSYPG